jgi:hypothetical protein
MAIIDQTITDEYALYNGDCVEVAETMPGAFAGMSVFSPPFADLYSYSDSPKDMGNCKSYDEFFEHFGYLVKQLARVMMPGRIVAVHCMDIPAMKERDGYIGLKDFPSDIIRTFQNYGFVYHSRHVIWKDPLIEATRTKALGLMHKQLCKDSTRCRAGLPDYLIGMRAPGENDVPVTQGEGMTRYVGADDPGGSGVRRSHNIWRAYASPVWMDIRQTNTMNFREAREHNDEKHICPLQLDVIERAVVLWSNPGEVVFTPFMGVGSEVYGAVLNGRKGVGVELKPSYYRQAVKNCKAAAVDAAQEEMPLLAGVHQ